MPYIFYVYARQYRSLSPAEIVLFKIPNLWCLEKKKDIKLEKAN